jgi:Fuc2NAc and GlcNAc transferase
MPALWVGLTFLLSVLLCGLYLKLARRWQHYDIPNERSAHSQPTPKGGGVGIFAALLLALAATSGIGEWPAIYLQLMLLAGALVVVGVIDDRYNLPVLVRLVVYGVACLAAILLLYWPSPLWWLALAGLYALWLVNLFNFMDGIDGIAAAEAVFVAAAAAALALWQGGDLQYPLFCLLLAAACLGFIVWNWAPARLFMGDAGSVSVGFLLAALSMLGDSSGVLPLSCWLILLALFLSDATVTLLLRAVRGEDITQAHSQHMYQRLARQWGSHGRVVVAMTVVNLLYLLPLAGLALRHPAWTPWILPVAYAPLVLAVLKAGKLP